MNLKTVDSSVELSRDNFPSLPSFMKNKLILLLGLFFLCGFASAQIRSGEIVYKVEFKRDIEQILDTLAPKYQSIKSHVVKDLRRIKKTTPYLTFNLKFHEQHSTFDMQSVMSNDNGMDLKEAALMAAANGLFYTDTKKNNSLHQFESMGEEILVERNLDSLDWKIGEGIKTIKGYTCKKATAIIHFNAVKKGQITAWFCPDLPFQFGPIGFGGLPGMILGLERNYFYFYADTVKLSQENKTIKKPKQGRFMTLSDFYGGVKEMVDKR